jgi:hypothetical protein
MSNINIQSFPKLKKKKTEAAVHSYPKNKDEYENKNLITEVNAIIDNNEFDNNECKHDETIFEKFYLS